MVAMNRELMIEDEVIPSEESLIVALLRENDGWYRISDKITESDFASHKNRTVFKAISLLASKSEPFDVLTVSEHIINNGGPLDTLAFVSSMMRNVSGAPSNVEVYARLVKERGTERSLKSLAIKLNDVADARIPVQEKLETFTSEISAISSSISGTRPRSASELMVDVVKYIETRAESGSTLSGSSTGFDDLDDLMSGTQDGDLIIVAGRPSMGKTTFAMNIAEHSGVVSNRPTLIFSLEMPGESLILRSIASLGGIDFQRLRNANMDAADWDRFTEVSAKINMAPIAIEDKAAISVVEMKAAAARFKIEHGDIGLIIIDYIQLMSGPGKTPNEVVGNISRGLKGLAKEMGCPVIALSQLNRSLEQRVNKRPIMSDLRESGAIEQDADVIIFIYRDEVYDDDIPVKGYGEAIIAKQRNGPIGTVVLKFEGRHVRYLGVNKDSVKQYANASQAD